MIRDTETASPRSLGLDTWPDEAVLDALWESQAAAAASVRPALPEVAGAARAAHRRLANRGAALGRLVYAGAGSSGRIAFGDGVELGPTFGWPDERLILLLAGGDGALRRAVEGAEDDTESAIVAIRSHAIGANDVVVAVAASGRTPFAVAVLTQARTQGALTIGIANAPGPLLDAAEHPILVTTGAEVIAGSTRLKAGTAQKIVLNLFSTLLMTRLGHVHDGRMVDMRLSNDKLRRRAVEIIRDLAGGDAAIAAAALQAADGHIKLAVLIARGHTPDAAMALLRRHDFHLRSALESAS